jgi:hypothetical protein
MKKLLFILLSIAILSSCITKPSKKDPTDLILSLEEQFESQNYFKLKSNFEANSEKLSDTYIAYYNALIAHVFNQQELSNQYIDSFLSSSKNTMNDTLMHRLYRVKRMNHINNYEYLDAYNTSSIIIDDYRNFEDSAAYNNLINEQKIWSALQRAPKQEIIKQKDTKLAMHKDKVGLMNIETLFGADTIDFLFDTGANFSVITRSLAEKLTMDIIDADFYVTAATGKEVTSSIAIANEFYVGNILIKNAVFLVFNDEDLSFPQVDYYPNGAIGFPVIEAFDEMHIHNDGSILIPQEAQFYSNDNLALDGLTPMIAVLYKSDTLNFNFDTGGNTTSLYHTFYMDYADEIDSTYTLETFTNGGGGGLIDFEGFVLDSLTLGVAGNYAVISKVRLHKDPINKEAEMVHGNFGQDFIKQFDSMIISFKHASIVFEK